MVPYLNSTGPIFMREAVVHPPETPSSKEPGALDTSSFAGGKAGMLSHSPQIVQTRDDGLSLLNSTPKSSQFFHFL